MSLFRKRNSRLTPALAWLSSLTAAAVVLALGLVYLALPVTKRAGQFTVASGEGAAAVAAHLKRDGIIRSEALFLAVLKGDGTDRQLQPGTYDLRGVASLSDLGRRLTGGGLSREELVLTVREGWTIRDIETELRRLGLADAASFAAAVGEPAATNYVPPTAWLARYPFLKTRIAGTSLEGFLFPDTYRLFRDATAASVAEKMLDNFDRHMDNATVRAIDASGREFRDVIVMASVLEREVQTPADRRLVADLFWRRLAKGMRLQADSTINYVTGGQHAAVSGRDLETDSPYNTYRHDGLPPGPIGNPGLDAIMAAAAPTANDYWYFLTDAAGSVHYAKTYDEHLANKAKYLR